MAAPQVPPRPVRSQHPGQPATGATGLAAPQVPPRPAGRRADRSVSPGRDAFAQSPLNDSPFPAKPGGRTTDLSPGVYGPDAMKPPSRPPSVTLPSIGQEGSEYADFASGDTEVPLSRSTSNVPHETRNVGDDLPLHAPKPSLSQSDAKARISNVTRTDSSQAVAAGLGRRSSLHLDDKENHGRSLSSKPSASFRSPSSASTERPGSAQAETEQGIPEIGRQVPMYPNAGDVQAPSPAPFASQHPAGVGFHNDGSKPRQHGRKHSGREVFHAPPDSYGLHGHGPNPANVNKFEKAWYERHPEAQAREEGHYSPALRDARSDFVLSSEDLNKIVRDTAAKGSGFGTSPNVVGLPDEQIGYMASDEYTSRMTSPRPGSGYFKGAQASNSQTHVESPLRKSNFPTNVIDKTSLDTSRSASETVPSDAIIEEAKEDVIHVDEPTLPTGFDRSTDDLTLGNQNFDGEGGLHEEAGHDVPILAADEFSPQQSLLQPAVSPVAHRDDNDGGYRSAPNSRPASRPASRPGSIAGLPAGLARFTSHDEFETHTPLEDVEEYEPLFTDDETSQKKPMTQTQRLKHRMERARFPSKDIWEDSPEHAQLMAEVKTPELAQQPPQKAAGTGNSTAFEPPEVEAARKGEVDEEGKAELLPKEERVRRSNFQPNIRQEMERPGMAKRFPSRDIWEDSPDHAQLSATVGEGHQESEKPENNAAVAAGAVVQTGMTREGATAGESAVPTLPAKSSDRRALEGAVGEQPMIPRRPQKTAGSQLSQVHNAVPSADETEAELTELKKTPSIPDRPRPQVPARPAKKPSADSPTSPSPDSASADRDRATKSPPPAPKPKPAVPARPAANKITALQGNFLSDLNNRLKLGPQGPPPKLQEKAEEAAAEEKATLADARKDRARGPARRKPAATAAAAEASKSKARHFTMSMASTMWEINEDGDLRVPDQRMTEPQKEPGETAPEPSIVTSPQASAETPPVASTVTSPETSTTTVTMAADTRRDSEHVAETKPTTTQTSSGEHAPDSVDAASKDTTSPTSPKVPSSAAMPSSEASGTGLLGGSGSSAENGTEAPVDNDASVQTGERTVTVDVDSDSPSKLTVYEGGDAKDGSNVVVKEAAAKRAEMTPEGDSVVEAS